jgi:hypothetical protein
MAGGRRAARQGGRIRREPVERAIVLMCTLPRGKVTAGPAARIGPRCESAPSAAAVNGYVPAVPPASRPRWQSALRHAVSANQFRNVRSSGPARERDLARRTTGLTPGTAPIDAAPEASASEHGHRRYCSEHVPPRCRKRAKLPRDLQRRLPASGAADPLGTAGRLSLWALPGAACCLSLWAIPTPAASPRGGCSRHSRVLAVPFHPADPRRWFRPAPALDIVGPA